MAFSLSIPQTVGDELSIEIEHGECLYVLGANGSGKSSLMHHFYKLNRDISNRISAHRQTWFASDAISITPHQRIQQEQNIKNSDVSPDSRWKDDYSSVRPNISIYDLIISENARSRQVCNAIDSGNIELAKEVSKIDSSIKVINELLYLSNIPIEISINTEEQVVASKEGSTPYSIAKLSDGERNAILIASNVLTAKEGALLLIDEPERHLHRSIISPLLTHLFTRRKDCGFIISTHDVMLPIDNPDAKVLLVRSCQYENNVTSSWDSDLIEEDTTENEFLKKDILGARRKVIFIEGTENSLDKSLYNLIFRNISIIPKSSCKDVENIVKSIRESDNLHWLNAFGVIDSDHRSSGEIDDLKEKGIYAISVYSVESIYYHPDIQKLVAEKSSELTGDDFLQNLEHAKKAILDTVKPHIKRLSQKVAEKRVREEIFRNLPSKESIESGLPISIEIDTKAILEGEEAELQTFVETSDIEKIISKYPLRETPALSHIARSLGFQSRSQYENSVRQLITNNEEARRLVESFFSGLETKIHE